MITGNYFSLLACRTISKGNKMAMQHMQYAFCIGGTWNPNVCVLRLWYAIYKRKRHSSTSLPTIKKDTKPSKVN